MNRNSSQSRTGNRRPPILTGFLLSAALTGVLAGCGGPAPELSNDAARELQSQVLAVTEAAAADDAGTALTLLDELATRLDGAAARGEVSFKRHQSIGASIDAVRVDLTARKAAVEAAAQAAAEQAAAEKAAAEKEAAAQAAAAQAAAEQAAAEQAAAERAAAQGKADKPKGKGKDKD
ncbi:mucin-associated surface protein [Arthrobacter sp. PAMC25284]|uniref:mucin-associated surface protein n=1 Tax=Arthrobacter sp. PAMC25284 TaxID=2861279 RepID=UPI001C624C8B|nr:mucin-associated surface protein [Arthrobacter sp. PAMC25284]QYF91006.1 mucin-associated surface protein [Arthrobacter sp. PAMC25284]